ncbi:MAG: polysaccharide biosynthesis/export family protein [Planctomycetaceae bacterium]|jgi:polysaccharide biosynthesis/export protein|nr:polysaccharide biosynthesis/export family protein [Planctomycetaceae bacterium]MBT6486623.1 polysaccharide biosynthesis/export family protein [Planctomycetaceae bacterium]MBT6496827.1 polysaccharide biosynthesis/export family protein [Planctomycetaceae bacterium]
MSQPTNTASTMFPFRGTRVGLLVCALLVAVPAGCASRSGGLATASNLRSGEFRQQNDSQNEQRPLALAGYESETQPVLQERVAADGTMSADDNRALQGDAIATRTTSCNRCLHGCSQCMGESWSNQEPIAWEVFAQGEYIGPARSPHLPEYRLRVDDTIEFVYRLTGKVTAQPYRLNVNDELQIESLTIEGFDRTVIIQPDGTITLARIGQIAAAGRSVKELREALNQAYSKHLRDPNFVVTPLKSNSKLEELRSSVDSRFGAGGQNRQARVTPEGTIQLPAIGSVSAQGLTLAELQSEIEHRYGELVHGLEVTTILVARAPRSLYVVGEVRNPGRFPLEGPTTVMQAIALAGSWNIGAKLNHVIVLRRDENWQLIATRLPLHDAFFGKTSCPDGEIWLRDSDIVIVPKSRIQWTGDLIELFFTRGLYGVLPINGAFQLRNLSVI